MKLTNKNNLPQPIVDAIRNDNYSGSGADISVTTLVRPPRAVALQVKHADEITEDASDRVWSLLGQLTHLLLERAGVDGLMEHRLTTEVNGWTVTGQVDRYFDGVIQDYKLTQMSKVDPIDKDWEPQLNLYAELLRRQGHAVKKIEIIAIIRDWYKAKSLADSTYPPSQVVVLSVPLWSVEKTCEYLLARVKLHQQARIKLPECTPEERWAKPTLYRVKKKNAKRAIPGGVFASLAQAEIMLEHVGPGHFIDVTEGSQTTRCNYCSAAPFCEQFKKIKEQK